MAFKIVKSLCFKGLINDFIPPLVYSEIVKSLIVGQVVGSGCMRFKDGD